MSAILSNIHFQTVGLMGLELFVWIIARQISREIFAWLRARETSFRIVPHSVFAKLDAGEFLARAGLLLLLFLAETFTIRHWIQVCSPPIFQRYDPVIRKVISGGVKAVVIIAGFIILRRMAQYLYAAITSRLKAVPSLDNREREQRARTLVGMLRGIFTTLLIVTAILWILSDEFGISVLPLLTGAGLAGLIVAFSVQSLIKDFFAGFFIILENHYKLGDYVKIADRTGFVENLSLRVTVLREESGTVHFIPNGEVKVVSNMSLEWARAIVEIPVPYAHDPATVIRILTDQAARLADEDSMKSLVTAEPEISGMNDTLMTGSLYRVMFRTRPRKDIIIAREFRKRATAALFADGIPFAPLQPGTTLSAPNADGASSVVPDSNDKK